MEPALEQSGQVTGEEVPGSAGEGEHAEAYAEQEIPAAVVGDLHHEGCMAEDIQLTRRAIDQC